MNQRYPQHDTPETIEGTAAHWVSTELLAGRVYPEGTAAPNGVIVTGEMLDGAELFVDTVRRLMPPGANLHIEETLTMHYVHALCFGTPDVWARTGVSKKILIVDYKWGHGFVDEYFNPQGLLYAAGVIEKELDPKAIDPDLEVSFTIIQPRCYYRGEPVRTHTYKLRDATHLFLDLHNAAKAATEPTPTATTNPECGHCPGRHACPALQRAAYADAEYADARQPHDLTPQAAALELRMLDRAYERLGARVDGLKELTLANIKGGASIPYYVAEPGRGRQQWTAAPEQIIAIGQMLGKDLAKPGVVTPAQAKKLGIDEAVITSYSANTPGSVKLIPQHNESARKVFGRSGE